MYIYDLNYHPNILPQINIPPLFTIHLNPLIHSCIIITLHASDFPFKKWTIATIELPIDYLVINKLPIDYFSSKTIQNHHQSQK